MRNLVLAALLALAGCDSAAAPARLRVDGHAVVLETTTPVRGLLLDLDWDDALKVDRIDPGAGVIRLNVVRAARSSGSPRARVLLTDSRRLELPTRGAVVELEATGPGSLRVVSAQAAGEGGVPIDVEVLR